MHASASSGTQDTAAVAHFNIERRRHLAAKSFDATRIIVGVGSTVLVGVLSIISFAATLGGIRFAAVFAFPVLWVLMFCLHSIRSPPLLIIPPTHPGWRQLIVLGYVSLPSPKRRALMATVLAVLWMTWGLLLYIPIWIPVVLDVAFLVASVQMGAHTIVSAIMLASACRAWAYSMWIAGEQLNIAMTGVGDWLLLSPESMQLTFRHAGSHATDLSLRVRAEHMRMTVIVANGPLSSAKESSTAKMTCRQERRSGSLAGNIMYPMDSLNSMYGASLPPCPTWRRKAHVWYEWKMNILVSCGRVSQSCATIRFPVCIENLYSARTSLSSLAQPSPAESAEGAGGMGLPEREQRP